MLMRNFSGAGKRNGAVAVQAAISLTVLLGIAAITIDGGLLQAEKRRAQATADAAALAAAADLFKRYNTNNGTDPSPFPARDSALAIAAANGYTSANSVITPNAVNGSGQPEHGIWIPPISGDHIGQPGYVEVAVQYNQPRYFSSIFGSGNISVRARAVARGLMAESDANLLVLNPTAAMSLETRGNGRLTVAGKIVVDSNASNAARVSGNSIVQASQIDVVGGVSLIGNGMVFSPTSGSTSGVHSNDSTLFAPDPLTSLAPPSAAGMPVIGNQPTQQYIPQQNDTMQPGVYRGGIDVAFTGVKMASGIYYIERGDFRVRSGASLASIGGGVLIYLTNGASSTYAKLSFETGGQVTLNPMSAGPYSGIMVFQDRTAPVNNVTNRFTMSPAAGSIIHGMIYVPRAALLLGGNNVTLGDSFIVDRVELLGNAIITVPGTPLPAGNRRLFGLVE